MASEIATAMRMAKHADMRARMDALYTLYSHCVDTRNTEGLVIAWNAADEGHQQFCERMRLLYDDVAGEIDSDVFEPISLTAFAYDIPGQAYENIHQFWVYLSVPGVGRTSADFKYHPIRAA